MAWHEEGVHFGLYASCCCLAQGGLYFRHELSAQGYEKSMAPSGIAYKGNAEAPSLCLAFCDSGLLLRRSALVCQKNFCSQLLSVPCQVFAGGVFVRA